MKKILVVVDMQKDFVDGALGTKEAAAIADNVANKIKNFDGEIIVTYDTHLENYMETREGKKLPVPHCIQGTDGWRLDKRVEEALGGKDYAVIQKPTFGAAALPMVIEDKYGKDVEITLVGLCTDICVVSNALILKAHFIENEIYVDASCCAGVTPESHAAALATMKMCQINVINE